MSIARLMQMASAGARGGWDLANAVYSGVSFSISSQDGLPFGLFFKPDGTKMYIVGRNNDSVYEYDLSTAWDVSSASYLQAFSVSVQDASPSQVFFKLDGTKMYVVGINSDSVHEYDLSTAWDISTASVLQSFSVSAQDGAPSSLFFKPDGTKMYVSGNDNDSVFEYDLSTAWDVSTASYNSVSFSVAGQDTFLVGLSFKPDGSKMYFAGRANDSVYEYDLSTAWDISSASYLQSFSVNSQEANVSEVSFKPDGTKMYVVGATSDTVFAYDL
jgi:DNA-binding beta-propeller fold protein YncE